MDATALESPWTLPQGARMPAVRSSLLRVLKVFTDRQHQLDSSMLSAVALLLALYSGTERQVAELSARVDMLESAARDKEDSR